MLVYNQLRRRFQIVLGHNANTKEELINMIENKQWDRLLKRVKIKPGDFFYVPAGTIHSLGKGVLVLETQQRLHLPCL